jgi:hypothetical protein
MAQIFNPRIIMKNSYPTIQDLRIEFGSNKEIPSEYEELILKTLSHYPELRNTHIRFKKKSSQNTPYETNPSARTFFALKPSYTISWLDAASEPDEMVLFKNLPEPARMGVLAHELGHVLQYENKGPAGRYKIPLKNISADGRRDIERQADIIAIEHGLGFELYTYARFIRAIPGYIQQHKEIDINQLHPNEILEALPPEQLQEFHK